VSFVWRNLAEVPFVSASTVAEMWQLTESADVKWTMIRRVFGKSVRCFALKELRC